MLQPGNTSEVDHKGGSISEILDYDAFCHTTLENWLEYRRHNHKY
jgi:hypothetical protein